MSGKRRDNKSRVLQLGEYQDAIGRYYYKYKEMIGKRRNAYSWNLIPIDGVPQGKKKDKCLRDKIRDIERELSRGVCHGSTCRLSMVKNYCNKEE